MSGKLKKKPQLSIEINSDDNEECKEVKYVLLGAKSAKNQHELKRFNFVQTRPVNAYERIARQDRIDRLQREKAQLLESLEILKNGAVSAIVQKQEIISKLRKLFTENYTPEGNDRDDSKMQQLQNLLQYIKDLEQQRNDLKAEAEKQRRHFETQIEEREQIIQELHNELNWSVERIQSLEKYDKLLEEKIRVMEESNDNLSILLNQSQETLEVQRKKHNEESQLLKNKSSESIHQGSDSENGSSWNPRSMRKIANSAHHDSERDLNFSMSRSLDESAIESKIKQIQNQHLVEIQDLTDFYESRIETLKKLCEQYPEMPFANQRTSATKNKPSFAQQVLDCGSNYSGLTNQIYESQRNRETQKILKKNLSLGSFNSGSGLRMDPIDERQEIESPRRTLRKELSGFKNSNSNMGLHKTSSDRSIGRQSSSSNHESNQQKQSQRSYKYFEYPTSSFKKNKSHPMPAKSETSNSRKQIEIDQDPEKKSNASGKSKSKNSNSSGKGSQVTSQLWEKLFWFASGTITGGILLKFGNKLFK